MNVRHFRSNIDHAVRVAALGALSCVAATAAITANAAVTPDATPAAATPPARQCLADLHLFSAELQKSGYWRDGSDFGYGYPIYGYGYGFGYSYDFGMAGRTAALDSRDSAGYWRARPGYEVRTLLASAQILAQRGDEAGCETLLTATRETYVTYSAELRSTKTPHGDVSRWRRQEIATAQPVATNDVAYRSDQLIGTSVINAQDESLGSVEDIVMSPKDGTIAYLVIGHGGVLGFGEKYAPVPWADFKSTSASNLMVLSVTPKNLDAAPQVSENQFAGRGDFTAEGQKVNDYWATHLSP